MDDTHNQAETLSKEGQKVKDLLADFLGTESDDLNLGFSFSDDLSMKPTDISDFFEIVRDSGLDLGDSDITEILLLSDLVAVVEANNLSE